MPERVPVIALAGGTGTGKSTLARALAEQGAAVIDADRVGHATLERPEVVRALVEEFGAGIVRDDGSIDRRTLGAIVFGDEARLRALNRIVHPPLVAEIGRRIDSLRHEGRSRLIVVDAALWPQFEPRPPVDLFLMTTAPPEERRARVVHRDGIDEEAAARRVERQRGLDAFLDEADAVLDTARPKDEVRRDLFALLDARFGPHWRRSA